MADIVTETGAGFSEYTPPPETPAQIIDRLSKLSPIEYDQSREREAQHLGIRVSTLDDEVKKARGEESGPTHGRRVALKPHMPHSEPVDLGDVLNDLADTIDRHLVVAPAARDVITVWVAHTWVYRQFDHTPRLAITSPEKRCGKSTLLELLRCTCMSPVKADNLSASSLFRTVETLAPLTLLIDEADTHLRENAEELRGVLNSGFEASGSVIRVTEISGEHTPVQFATFCPVALAAIGRLPETLEDRSVPVRLERKAADQIVQKFRDTGARDHMALIGRKLARWAQDGAGNLNSSPSIPTALNDREGDITVPLLAIADTAGGGWATRCRQALRTLFGDRAHDADAAGTGAMLLADIREIFTETGSLRLTSAELAQRLGQIEDKPWAEWRHGKPMTSTQLARALSPFRVRPHNMKVAGTGEVRKGYQRDQFEDAWTRYLSSPPKAPICEPLPATPPEESTTFSEFSSATKVLPVERSGATADSVADREHPGSGYGSGSEIVENADMGPPVAGSAAKGGTLGGEYDEEVL